MFEENLKRGKGINTSPFGIRDIYRFYRKRYKFKQFSSKFLGKGPNYNILFEQYRDIIRDCNQMICNAILEEASVIKLPNGLGYMKIEKKPIPSGYFKAKNNLKVDWKKSLKYHKFIYHLNEDREFHRYRWLWKRDKQRVKHIKHYKFTPIRPNKRRIPVILKDKTKDFLS